MRKYLLFSLFIFLPACTVYTEKQSAALSTSVYAAKDSIDSSRVDLAEKYINESVRIVKPPKKRVDIQPVYKKTIDTVASQSKSSPIIVNKQRVLIVPERYRNDTVVVVNSDEYQQLLKDKETFAQIEKDNKNLIETKQLVDQELIKQMEYNDKMIRDLNIMQKKLVEKDLAILQRNVVILLLFVAIGIAGYLRIKGVL